MPFDDIPNPILVTRTEQLDALVKSLQKEALISVDTESNSLYAYREQVCLIQISTPDADYLVDPLALPSLDPLAGFFADAAIEKIFHAAEYDLLCLRRDYGFQFKNLFDTQIAARILGWEKVGLGSILERLFHVHADKKYQRANWGIRPLKTHMLHYAQLDTHYLIPLREHLKALLQENNIWDLAVEDFTRACHVNHWRKRPVDELCWRVNGAQDLTPQKAAVLQELCMLREGIAEKMDRPVFKVIGNKALIQLAETCPKSEAELRSIHGLSPRLVARHGREMIAAIQRGLNGAPRKYPKKPRLNQAYLDRMEALRDWRKHTGRSHHVASDIILPRDLMFEIVKKNPTNAQNLKAIMVDIPWRFENFGGQILHVLQKL